MAMTADTKLYLALGVLVALGGAYFLQSKKDAEESAEHSYQAQTADLPKIAVSDDDIKKIDKVVIQTPPEEAEEGKEKKAAAEHVLVKKGEEWQLEKPVQALANKANVDSLLKNLKSLKVKELITDDEKEYAQYDVTENKAIHATFYKGDKAAYEFWFGKDGGLGQVTRVKGTDGAFAVGGFSRYLYGRDTKGWRDLSIFKFDEKKAKSVELSNENGTFSFTKDGDDWKAKYGKKAAPQGALKEFAKKKVDDLLRAFTALNANAFGDGKSLADAGLEEPVAELTITLEDGAQRKLVVGSNAEGSSRWVKTADGDQIYSISSWAGDWTTADTSKFQDKPKDEDDADADAEDDEGAAPGMPPGMPPGNPHAVPNPHG
jgi:hypothetical protein